MSLRKMNNEKLKDTVDVLAENGIKKIILIGGEPTINNDIIDIIKYINKKNIMVEGFLTFLLLKNVKKLV